MSRAQKFVVSPKIKGSGRRTPPRVAQNPRIEERSDFREFLAEALKAENEKTNEKMSSPSTPVRSESELSGASKVLEDKLLKLKGQLHDLRSSIKGFEEDFDRRLDQCLAEILGMCV